jgi:branched-chain amino acid transport system substrate-binding protein
MTQRLPVLPFCAALLLLPATWACAEEVIKIGHVAPLSGPTANKGKENQHGARMAIDDLNAKGFLIDGKKVKFVLVSEDDGSDPKQATAAAQKLVDAKVNGVVGHFNSGTTMPASKIYFSQGIPQISPSATNPLFTRQGFNTAFRVVANDVQLGGALGRYAMRTMKVRRVAVISDATAYGQGVADEFAKGAKEAASDLLMVGKEYTNPNATDFTAILTSLKAKKPDLIFFGGMETVAGPMLRQMKALGVTAKFMGGDGMCAEALSTLAGESIGEGLVTCAEVGGVSDEYDASMKAFQARFARSFTSNGSDGYAAYAYDAVMVLAQAMQNARSSNPALYLPELAKIRYRGVTGPIAFDAHGDLSGGALTLFTFSKGKKTRLQVVH